MIRSGGLSRIHSRHSVKVAEPHISLASEEGRFGSKPMTEHSPVSPLTLAETDRGH